MIDDNDYAIRAQVFANTPLWAQHSLTIRDKNGVPINLQMSPSQVKLDQAVRRARKLGQPVRIAAVKGRQVHMSLGAVLQIYKATAFFEGQNAIILANDHKTNVNLFNYFEQMVDSYVPWCGVDQLRVVSRNTAQGQQKIEFDGGGTVFFGSAGTFTVARGFSFRHALLSEAAFYPANRADQTTSGLMNAFPSDGDTTVIVESTGFGRTSWFYKTYMRADDPRRRGDWRSLFFAWWEHPENVLPLRVDRVEFERSLDEDEKAEREKYKLTLEQLHWRRWKIGDSCNGSVRQFRQEHPGNAAEAFQTSGRSFFDSVRMNRFVPFEDATTYDLELERIGMELRPVARPRLDKNGPLTIFRSPVKGRRYIIGADTAEGIDTAEDGAEPDTDFSVAWVLDEQSAEQVAIYRERLDAGEFGARLAALGQLYSSDGIWAFICPESNTFGVACIKALLAAGYPQALIYQRTRTPDNLEPKTTVELGWRTTSATRPLITTEIATALLEQCTTMYDPVSIQEHLDFQILKGKPQAPVGGHDDTVFAHGLALVARQQARWCFARMENAISERLGKPKFARGTTYGPRRTDESKIIRGV
jgi:hypothetical protein